MQTNETLSDLHAAVSLAEQAARQLASQYSLAESQARQWQAEENRLYRMAEDARRVLREAQIALRETTTYLNRPIDGTDEASAVATVEAFLKGEVA